MKRVITVQQKSDMGSGFGYISDVSGCTLKEVLDFCANNDKLWGCCC